MSIYRVNTRAPNKQKTLARSENEDLSGDDLKGKAIF